MINQKFQSGGPQQKKDFSLLRRQTKKFTIPLDPMAIMNYVPKSNKGSSNEVVMHSSTLGGDTSPLMQSRISLSKLALFKHQLERPVQENPEEIMRRE